MHLLDDQGPGVLQDEGVRQGREEAGHQAVRLLGRVASFHQSRHLWGK